jgi:hypothetical protein
MFLSTLDVRDHLRVMPRWRYLLVHKCRSAARIPVDAHQSIVVHCGARFEG